MRCFGILLFVLLLTIPSSGLAKSLPAGHPITRREFVRMVIDILFSPQEIASCDEKTVLLKDIRPRTRTRKHICLAAQKEFIGNTRGARFRPLQPITLAEASVVLVKAFNLPLEQSVERPWWVVTSEQEKAVPLWALPSLSALARENAVPPSFFSYHEAVTWGEAQEMLVRLSGGIRNRSALTYEDIVDFQYPYQYQDLLRFGGDFSASLSALSLSPQAFRAFLEPATYQIIDTPMGDRDQYCRRFVVESIGVEQSLEEEHGVPREFRVTLEGQSVDFCSFPHQDMQPGTCPEGVLYIDDPRCNIGQPRPYTLTLEGEGKALHLVGAEGGRLKIIRMPLEKLCREFAPVCPGWYEYTRLETKGTITENTLTSGESIHTYRTPWKSIFADLRGVPFLKAVQEDADTRTTYIYEYPAHNRDHYGHGTTSYEECFTIPTHEFCMKKEGGNLVIGSRLPLGERVTLWIDEYFRR